MEDFSVIRQSYERGGIVEKEGREREEVGRGGSWVEFWGILVKKPRSKWHCCCSERGIFHSHL